MKAKNCIPGKYARNSVDVPGRELTNSGNKQVEHLFERQTPSIVHTWDNVCGSSQQVSKVKRSSSTNVKVETEKEVCC